MKTSVAESQHADKSRRWFLLALILTAGILNIGELLLLWRMNDSLIRVRILHAGWLLTVWIYSLILYLFVRRHDTSISPSIRFITIGMGAVSIPLSVWFPFSDYIHKVQFSTQEIIYGPSSRIFFAILILVALNGVYHAERFYRSFHHERRFRLTLFALIGTLSFWMLLGCLALMYGLLNMNALMVAFVPSLVANILLTYHVLKGSGNLQLEIRQSTLYRSMTLLVSGIFLLLLGLMGEIIVLIGTHLNFFVAFLSAFLILLLSLTVLLFGSIKERVQRFIARNFYKSYYDYRSEWERANQRILPIHDAQSLQREVLHAVTGPIGAERSCLLMQDATNQWFVAAWNGLQIQPTQIPTIVLDWIWRHGKPIEVKQISMDGEMLAPFTKSDVQIVVPIIFERQLMALVLLGPRSTGSEKYTQEDLDFLETIGGHISLAIANQKFRESLIEAEELKNFNQISTFVLHSLKNAAFPLSLILQNAEGNLDNPEFQKDMIQTMSGVVEKIRGLMSKLSTSLDQKPLEFIPTDLKQLVEKTVSMTGVAKLANIRFQQKLEPAPLVSVAPLEIQNVIDNLLINAAEAVDGAGEIQIRLDQRGTDICIEVSDTGHGISQDYIQNSLFKPFQTSKPKGLGIGLYQCKTIVEAHRGKIEVESTEGAGSQFRVLLPLKELGK
ncbi:MAG: PEP-CTERM system histidine kinase PrsK [Candidatus Poribacteria bacterium]|nr:PEP-CTERM system histidine kinase PrsK [Candidatus Poribacteria bacterium]